MRLPARLPDASPGDAPGRLTTLADSARARTVTTRCDGRLPCSTAASRATFQPWNASSPASTTPGPASLAISSSRRRPNDGCRSRSSRAGSHQVTPYASSPSKPWMPGCTLVNGIVSARSSVVSWPKPKAQSLAARLPAAILRRVQRRVQRLDPARTRQVARRAHHEQVAGARRRDVGDADAFRLVARDLERLVLAQLRRRPAGQVHRAAPPVACRPTATRCSATGRRRCPRAPRPGTRAPSPCARSSGGRRRCPPRGSAPRRRASPPLRRAAARRSRGTTARRPLRTAAPARRRTGRWRAPARPTAAARRSRARATPRAATRSSPPRAAGCAGRADRAAAPGPRRPRAAARARRRARLQRLERPEVSRACAVVEQHVVAEGEQRAAQRPEHRQLVVRPLDRGERRAQRLDLLALVEALAADQQVRQVARLERLHVRPRDVEHAFVRPRVEAPEQQADVARLDRRALGGPLAVGHRPAAVAAPASG